MAIRGASRLVADVCDDGRIHADDRAAQFIFRATRRGTGPLSHVGVANAPISDSSILRKSNAPLHWSLIKWRAPQRHTNVRLPSITENGEFDCIAHALSGQRTD